MALRLLVHRRLGRSVVGHCASAPPLLPFSTARDDKLTRTSLQVAIFLPETYHPILLKQRAKRLRKEHPEQHGDKYAELEKADFGCVSSSPCCRRLVDESL